MENILYYKIEYFLFKIFLKSCHNDGWRKVMYILLIDFSFYNALLNIFKFYYCKKIIPLEVFEQFINETNPYIPILINKIGFFLSSDIFCYFFFYFSFNHVTFYFLSYKIQLCNRPKCHLFLTLKISNLPFWFP